MPLIYKTLFEVKIMHEYYLTNEDGNTVFEEVSQQGRIIFLLKEFNKGNLSINADLQYIFPAEMLQVYEAYNLKLLTTYSGFKVMLRVNAKIDNTGTLVYEPVAGLPEDLDIYVLITKRNNEPDSYTLFNIKNPLTAICFFSSNNTTGKRTFPFLTSAVAGFDATVSYGQGQLALFAPGDIREFYKNSAGDQWQPVHGEGFASENDMLLLPLKFNYALAAAGNIKNIEFVLKDKNGADIKTFSYNTNGKLQRVMLDFSEKKDILTNPITGLTGQAFFCLYVSADNGYSAIHKVIFSDVLYGREKFSVVNIRVMPDNPDFNLLAGDGFLIKRKSAAGVWTEAPVFEIPFKSRFAFWRYKNDKGKDISVSAGLVNHLYKEDRALLSIKPRSSSKYYFKLERKDGTDPKYLPNPLNYHLQKDNMERLCLDIVVPDCKLFPVI